eukprot:UN02975
MFIHHHNNFPSLKDIFDDITDLKNYVENTLGCSFILSTMLRHPLERMLSHIFYTFSYVEKVNLAEWSYVYQNYMSHYILFNYCRWNEKAEAFQCGYLWDTLGTIAKDGKNWGLYESHMMDENELYNQTRTFLEDNF